MLESQTTTMKKNVRFEEGKCLDKIQPDQILKGRLLTIIDSNMHNTIKSWWLANNIKQVVMILD